ncbi:uncharacterized protein LOC127797122 isoform X2 [Diospyros lotus]|uniref:uncharacterized protein LOC127797122 isoform X2 n=1 Tax=Diospyros lotus TaxID=55363 RepID=UPI0022526B30|nr:uncharacterized protein LOC127797122 isoform X2 [Diospyros lotus]
MQGIAKSIRHPQSRTSGRNTLKRCKNNGEADNVVLIDVDSDDINNVIIIDVPESLKKKLLRKDRECHFETIICIDDDDENSDINQPGMGKEDGVDFHTEASSSGRSCPAPNHPRSFTDEVGNESQFVRGNLSPLKLSKCKRTYSGKASSRSYCGLGPDLDSISPDNDSPDCDFMEDSFGKLREQWEKANMKKKYVVHNVQSERGDQVNNSGFHKVKHQNVEVENATDQQAEGEACTCSSNSNNVEENSFPFVEKGVGNLGSTCNSPKKTPSTGFGLGSTGETSETKCFRSEVNRFRGDSFPVSSSFDNAEGQINVKHGGSSFCDEVDHCSQGPHQCCTNRQGEKDINPTNLFSQDKEKIPPAEPSTSKPDPTVHVNFGCSEGSLPDEMFSCFSTQHSVDIEFGHGTEKFHQNPSCKAHFHTEFSNDTSSVDKNKFVSAKPPFNNIRPSHETQVNPGCVDNDVRAVDGESYCQVPSMGKLGLDKEDRFCQDKVERVPKKPSLFSFPCEEVHLCKNMGSGELFGKISSNHQLEEKDGLKDAQDADVMNAVQDNIIIEREKHKETDEYKRAAEEEWASRQRELQLQAEEAQKLRRLRKREKAESMRLLDMERRLKQRVDEMRETQKKVRAAYKRALLSFHPDRASGSDLRQLVEAEEKFKLISRMKEKFSYTY